MAVVVSACLLGTACRHDARDRRSERVLAAVAGETVVAVCPEVLGELGVPRLPCQLSGGDGRAVLRGHARVVSSEGEDRTAEFLRGAREALAQAQAGGAVRAILKERSPSCGVRSVHRDGRVEAGSGVFAALLEAAGIPALSDEEV
jgi:uncharacterized protein YbbK (DUF523 family)